MKRSARAGAPGWYYVSRGAGWLSHGGWFYADWRQPRATAAWWWRYGVCRPPVAFRAWLRRRSWLPVGTRSLLYGAHQFILHPLFLFIAWWQLYGFPRDPRLWVAFIVHDWGYWGKHAMDDAEGQRHPELGGRIMARLFGQEWGDFTRLHSRYYAKLEDRDPSPLAAADKFVLLVTPRWCYLPLVRLSGEVDEYLALFAAWRGVEAVTIDEWYDGLRAHWADEVRRLAPGYEPRSPVVHRPTALLGALCGGLGGVLLIRVAGASASEALGIGAGVGLLVACVVLLWGRG